MLARRTNQEHNRSIILDELSEVTIQSPVTRDDRAISAMILTVIRLLEMLRNFRSAKCLSASVGNSCRKFAERSSCSRLNAPETPLETFSLDRRLPPAGKVISLSRRVVQNGARVVYYIHIWTLDARKKKTYPRTTSRACSWICAYRRGTNSRLPWERRCRWEHGLEFIISSRSFIVTRGRAFIAPRLFSRLD